MGKTKSIVTYLLLMGALFLFVSTSAQVRSTENGNGLVFSLSFEEPPVTITTSDIESSKFSQSIKITAKGTTFYNGDNVAYSFSLVLPNFHFNPDTTQTYTNDSKHFFDANRDAALMLNLGSMRFGNLFRSKEKDDILSKLATTDYKITTTNLLGKDDKHYILVNIDPGSVLKESSETKSKSEVAKLRFGSSSDSQIKILNPQPELPKVEQFKYKQFSEVFKPVSPIK